jgi:hypothetical protein
MYLGSFRLTVKLLPVVLVVIAAEFVLQYLGRVEILRFADSIVIFLVWSVLAFFALYFVLFPGKNYSQINLKLLFGFTVRNCGLGILFALPALVIPFLFLPEIEAVAKGHQNVLEGFFEFYASLIALFTALIIYSLLGTWLPAFLSGHGDSFANAFSRGKRSFFRAVWRMILGPGVLFVVSFLAFGALLSILDLQSQEFQESWIASSFSYLGWFIYYCFLAWAVVMAAWILSHAFLASEAEEETAEQLVKTA